MCKRKKILLDMNFYIIILHVLSVFYTLLHTHPAVKWDILPLSPSINWDILLHKVSSEEATVFSSIRITLY